MMTAQAANSRAFAREMTMPADADQDLVRRARAGDADAFSELVRRNQNAVYSLACRFMRDAALAEDMAQEAFLKAYRLLNGFRGDCSFSTWMYRVTCSVCLTELSRRSRRGEVESAPIHAQSPRERNKLDAMEEQELVRHCVAKLPEHYATAITLYYLDEVPYEEIAAAMGIPLGTLKTWMHRARRQLRELVEKELDYHGTAPKA